MCRRKPYLGSAPTIIVDSTAILAHDPAGLQWYGRPTIETSDGIRVLIYLERSGHTVPDGELHIRFSDDNGNTWSGEDTDLLGNPITNFPMNPPNPPVTGDAQEPWLMKAPNGDLILQMWGVTAANEILGTWQSISSDGGLTWGVPAQVSFYGDARDNLVATTEDHFVYNNIIYTAARHFTDINQTNDKRIFIKSEDNGVSWSYISDMSVVTDDLSEVGIEYLGNATIIAVYRSKTKAHTWRNYSYNMGLTWSTPEQLPIPSSARHRISTLSHLRGEENWWADDILIMWGFVWYSLNRRPALWVSLDRGQTWSEVPLWIDVVSQDNGYADMFYVTNNQFVLVGYWGTKDASDLKQYNLTITIMEN